MDLIVDTIQGFLPQISDTMILDVVTTILLLLGVIFFKVILVRLFTTQDRIPFEIRKRRVIHIRNIMTFLFIIGVVLIWSKELLALALTFVALAFAIVFSFKEVISSANWEIFRATTNAYTVGDYIEINEMRGVVLDHNFLSTTIQELGPGKSSNQFSGRSITIPNSTFFTAPLINETFMKDYVLHTLTIPMTVDDDWRRAEKTLLEAANEECSEYLDLAKHHFNSLSRKLNISPSAVDPRIAIEIPEPDMLNLILRFPTPFAGKWVKEQAILRKFLKQYKSKGDVS
jgi:small-conductance mechanosensitive channel